MHWKTKLLFHSSRIRELFEYWFPKTKNSSGPPPRYLAIYQRWTVIANNGRSKAHPCSFYITVVTPVWTRPQHRVKWNMREMKTEFLPTFASYYRILVNQYLDQNHYDHDLRCQPAVWTWRGSDVKACLSDGDTFPETWTRYAMSWLCSSCHWNFLPLSVLLLFVSYVLDYVRCRCSLALFSIRNYHQKLNRIGSRYFPLSNDSDRISSSGIMLVASYFVL